MQHTCYKILLLLLMMSASQLLAQRTLKGTVMNERGEALLGASIQIKNSMRGVIADMEGKYSLKLQPGDDSLYVSYLGYEAKSVALSDEPVQDIILKENSRTLDEVVVIGYGTVQKRDLTGAVESVDPRTEEILQYNGLQSFLQGRAKGVLIQSNSSEPGAPSTIRIRGANSLRGNNEPLYVIDGIIVNSSTEDTPDPLSGGNSYLSPQNGITGINPQDIESIEVLKDASATAIYGSRGANGVILITTKNGNSGKAKFTYNHYSRVGRAKNLIDVLNAEEYVAYQNDGRAAQGFPPDYYTYSDGSVAAYVNSDSFMVANADSLERLPFVNWYDEIFQTSYSQNHRLNVSGGNSFSNYYIASGFTQSQGIIPGTDATQVDLLLKLNQQLGERWKLSPRISATYTRNRASKGTENLGSTRNSMVRQIVSGAPLRGVADNNANDDFDIALDGPLAWLEDYDDIGEEVRTLASVTLDYKISNALTYRVLAGADYRIKNRKIWFGTGIFRGLQANGEAGISQLKRFRYNVDNTLMYKTKIGRHHRINGTVGTVWDGTHIETSAFSASNFASKDLRFNGISFGQVYQAMQYDLAAINILSFLGRFNYSYRNRYLLTLSFRTDGTSKFSQENRFSSFPAAAVAWKLINEPFMKEQRLFSEAKLRAGWGLTGSQAIDPYQTLTRFGLTANLLSDASGNGITAVIPQNLANQDLIWETTSQYNVGLDLGFLEDRFTASVDAYYKRTYDLLQRLNIGPSAGFTTFVTNQGDLVNKGIELGLVAHILEGDFRWTVSGNISFNRNQITDLGLPLSQFGTQTYSAFVGNLVSGGNFFKVPANIFIEGQPAGLFWGYETDGIVSNAAELENAPAVQGLAPQLGDVLYVDQNGDGNITDTDLTIIGDPNPNYFFGLGTELSYKAVSLNVFLSGVQGNEIANGNLANEAYADGRFLNVRREAYLDAWSESNPDGQYPRLLYTNPGDFTDRMVEDGSFVRLSFISLNYQLPPNTIKGISNASIFVSGQNLLLFTNYSGFDPEVNSFAYDPLRRGIDWNSFPNQETITAGLTLSF